MDSIGDTLVVVLRVPRSGLATILQRWHITTPSQGGRAITKGRPRKKATLIREWPCRSVQVTRTVRPSLRGTGSQPDRTEPIVCASHAYATAPSARCFCLSSFSKFVTNASVVSNNPAILPALASAVRTTLTGSIIPDLSISTYLP